MANALTKLNLGLIAERLRAEGTVETVTVRELLSWFGAKRRGVHVVNEIRYELEKAQLTTDPDFEGSYIDKPVSLVLAKDETRKDATASGVTLTASAALIPGEATTDYAMEFTDPAHRISKLEAANRTPTTVSPDDPLVKATTTMLVRGYSQLPVMNGSREVKGVVSWQSIGERTSRGVTSSTVRGMMDTNFSVVRLDASIFEAIPLIVANDYVLVRAKDNSICGIVTVSDLSLQFLQLSEPFLLLGEIENHIRQTISEKFTVEDLRKAQDDRDPLRKVDSASDLNFGEYRALLDHPDRWQQSGLPWDRRVFCDQLEEVRIIRNEVMHFDPDPLDGEDIQRLREFARFLQRATNTARARDA
jgi:predicted transcriptional regulator